MRTFHTGGVAGQDITQGLPRIVELFEARKPKGLAQMAEAAGKVSVEETDKALKVIVTESSGEEHSYSFPPRTRLHVADGEKVEVGQQLNEGSLYPADLLAIRGRTDDRALPRRRGAEGLPRPGRRHQRQAHRADRPPDAEEGADRVEGLDQPAARASSKIAAASNASTRRRRKTAARRPKARRSSSGSPRPRWRPSPSSPRPPSRRRPRCSPTPPWRANATASSA